MALSFEESRKKLAEQAATPARMSLRMTSVSEEATWEKPANASFYTYYDNEYHDDKLSIVDNNKDITLSAEQINITQEKNSQYIPFEIPRYYDGFDLSTTELSIYWVNKLGNGSTAIPVDVYCSDDKIRFAWLVDDDVTAIAGKIKFEIHASGTNSLGYDYLWKTKTNEGINVIQALEIKGFIEPDEAWQESFIQKLSNQANRAEQAVRTAQAAADEAKQAAANLQDGIESEVQTAIGENYYTKLEVETYVQEQIDAIPEVDLNPYALKTELPTKVSELDNDTSLATETFVQEEIKKVDVSDQLPKNLSDLAEDEMHRLVTDAEKQEWSAKSDFSGSYNDLADKPTQVSAFENDAGYLTEHQSLDDYALKTDIPSLEGLATEEHVKQEIAKIDVSDQLVNYALKEEIPSIEGLASETYVQDAVAEVDVSEQLKDYAKSTDVDSKIAEVQTQANTNKSDIVTLSSKVSTNETNIENLTSNATTLSTKITELDTAIKEMADQAGYEYYATYGKSTLEATGEETDNVFTLYEVDGESESIKSQFVITGGSGGSTSATTLTVTRVTTSPLTITTSDKAIIEFNCTSYDADGETVDCSYTWKKGSSIIMSGSLTQGLNSFDLTEYVTTGTHKFTLTVTDEGGSMSVKTWTVQMVDVYIESKFNDQTTYAVGETVNFTYTPYGAIPKTVHFKLDGEELESVSTTASGLLQSYTLPAQSHGAHLLEVWVTATVNNVPIEPPHIYKDIIWYDANSDVPVIGCIYRSDYYGTVEARQYNTTEIAYVVYDPAAENPTINRYVDGESIGTQTLEGASDIWSYKPSEVGEKNLKIECGSTSVEIKLDVAELGITIEPVTASMAFDFNPTGRSNNDADRVWSDANTGVTMSVSDNFDWTNGGYQRDDNGDTYFCVKAGTTATINYNLFGADYDPKATGKEFKFVFKTTNVKKRSSTFLSCIDGETPIGIDMKVENAKIYASNKELYIPYCEEDIIEFEFNINKDSDIPMVMTYEDGVANRPLIYASDSSFMQLTAQPITIGSADCDVHVYRMKAYDTSLTDKEILTNFIADARNADEMIARYNRNQIYDENNALTPETLAEKCPDLRIIMIDAPWFTNDKDDKVGGTTIRQIYKGGDAVLDNWTCTGAKHSGQGTSSNKYGYAGRNIRLIMNEDESLFTFNGTNEDGSPITGKKFTFTRDSVPTDYVNIKVNIASSENQNNAQFAKRYNEFNPVVRPAKVADPKVKDTMEFHNCVVFIRENEEDLTKHREFNDNAWHFYAIGNMGDDKKTDKTRVNDSKDPKEFILEITDFDVPLAEFPTGKEDGTGGVYISPDEFVPGNTAYDNLYSEYTYDEEGKFKAFGAESYEFRYEMKGITDEQRQANIDAWREFYTFVVTSTDEEFVANIENYCVLDSLLYFYLFTERYLMVDNRAKNLFLHYGKCDDGVYRYDLCMAYDMDTSLGIDNTGKLILTYGQEDIDKDASGAYIYRAAESNFFCRIRDLFADRLKGMFQSRESLGAWSSTSLINQWDEAQAQFPEELWRLDIQRKYLRTYQGISVDNSIAGAQNPMFLEPMLNGRKKYQRRQFERNQELYMATKYVSTFAKDDFIRLRFNNPTNPVVKQDYTLYLTPYTDMYIAAEFGNTEPIVFRAKAGVEYPVRRETASDTADIVLIYGASFIQAIGDLSKCYLGDNDFSMASRLQSLVIGSDVAGYENTFMTNLALGNNKLLEYLDIRNVTGLNSVVDLSQCGNLIELRAEGSGATGVIFANGGKLERAYIPAVTSLTMKNLNDLETLNVASYAKLQKLIAENIHTIDTHAIVNAATTLNTVRLVGINWDKDFNIANTAILDRLYDMRGVDGNGYENSKSVVTGYIWVASGKSREMDEFNELWPYLTIEADAVTPQFTVTFVNDDGTVLDVQYVDAESKPVDPITRSENPIDTPTKASTVSTNYTYAGWDTEFVPVWSDQTIKATYTESTREYTIQYVSNNNVLQTSTAPYGSMVEYEGEIPTYTSGETSRKYHLFDGWDKSGYVNGDKVINAVFDSCQYADGYYNFLKDNTEGTDLSALRPVEIYMMLKLSAAGLITLTDYVGSKDSISIQLGNDFSYEDVEEQVLIAEKTVFNGSNYIDTGINLLSEDRDFVLAIDCKVDSGNSNGAVFAQCFSGLDTSGFRLSYNSGVKFAWGTSSATPMSTSSREMIVLRHIKGESGIHVYASNVKGASYYTKLDGNHQMMHDVSLVFGCSKLEDGSYEQYANGTVYWSKIWYADLGDDACANLAYWPHEAMKFEACCESNGSLKRYYLSDNSGSRSSITFIASNALPQPVVMHTSTANSGGWANYYLNRYLNSRVYEAFPYKWRQLMKQVKVKSSIGDRLTELSSSDCYIFVPSVSEVDPGVTQEPYVSEGTPIKHFSFNTSRICYTTDGTAVQYWTRSPSVGHTNYVYRINTAGSSQPVTQMNDNTIYARIMISI